MPEFLCLDVSRMIYQPGADSMKTEHSIFKLTLFPIAMLMVVLAIGALVNFNAQRLAEQQAALIEDSFITAKRAELSGYVDLAMSTIAPLYSAGRDDAAALEEAKAILRNISYGSDGYFFVYDLDGNNLVHPRQPELEGKNLGGMPAIRSLLNAARQGDGFQRYFWNKPSTRKEAEKLGYVVLLEKWGWMVGTGIYLDDVERTTQTVRGHVTGTLEKLMAIALAALLLVFVTGLMLNAREHRMAERQLKDMAQRIVTAQEEERARVSRELHEGLAGGLIAAKFKLELAEKKLSGDIEAVKRFLGDGLEKLIQAITEVRRISHGLRPAVLDNLGLSAAIDQLKTEFEERTGVRINLENTLADRRFNKQEELALYRIAQEALTNIERHTAATEVRVTLSHEPEGVSFVIVDNGRGFEIDDLNRTGGIGLRNMRERIEYLGGRFDIFSEAGCTSLMAILPGTAVRAPLKIR